MVYLRIADRIGHGDLLQRIAKLKLPAVGAGFVAHAGMRRGVVAFAAFLQFAENFFQGTFPDLLLAFGRNFKFAFFAGSFA